jgi:RNA polymerase subunit RPABC4/transcription elongation factor Spt4
MTEDVKIACRHCNNFCDVGQDFCEKCGESQREENDYFEP